MQFTISTEKKEKKHITHLIGIDKAFEQSQNLLMIKTLKKLGIE